MEFGKSHYVTEVSVASRSSIHHPVNEMTPRAPGELPNVCLGEPVPFLLESISKLSDALWRVRPSLDMSPKNVPLMLNWREVLGLHRPWKRHDSVKLQVILDKRCTMGSFIASEDECIPMPMGVGHNNRLNDIVSVVEPSDIPLADVEFVLPVMVIPPQTMTLPFL